MKIIRVRLPGLEENESDELLTLVTEVEGVVAALLDAPASSLTVVVSTDASALLVSEQVAALTCGLAAA